MDPPSEEPSTKRCRIAQTITEGLPPDILDKIVVFVGAGYYRYVAGTCREFKNAYERANVFRKTTYKNAAASWSCANICIMEVA
jgi:hypothetical protein